MCVRVLAQRSRKTETQVSGVCVYVRVPVCMSTREHVCMCICMRVCAFSCALPLSLLSWDVLKGNTKPDAQKKKLLPAFVRAPTSARPPFCKHTWLFVECCWVWVYGTVWQKKPRLQTCVIRCLHVHSCFTHLSCFTHPGSLGNA